MSNEAKTGGQQKHCPAESASGGSKSLSQLKKFFQSKANGRQKSEMRINPFHLFSSKLVGIEEEEQQPSSTSTTVDGEQHAEILMFNVTSYTHTHSSDEFGTITLRERREVCGSSKRDMLVARRDGIDNTGNFHWPTEEVLAHLMINHNKNFRSLGSREGRRRRRRVLELGAGYGLAGLCLASMGCCDVVLSDGNDLVVENLRHNTRRCGFSSRLQAALNHPCYSPNDDTSAVSVQCHKVLWQKPETYAELGDFDEIIAADCLFFDKFHEDLVELLLFFCRRAVTTTTTTTTEPSAVAAETRIEKLKITLLAPCRGKTLPSFLDLFLKKSAEAMRNKARVEFSSQCSTSAVVVLQDLPEGVVAVDSRLPPKSHEGVARLVVTLTDTYDDHVTRALREQEGGEAATPLEGFDRDKHYPLCITISVQ